MKVVLAQPMGAAAVQGMVLGGKFLTAAAAAAVASQTGGVASQTPVLPQ